MVTLRVLGGRLRLPDGTPRIVIIADASQSAEGVEGSVRDLVTNLLKRLPGSTGRVLHFLGSSTSYQPAGFLKDGARWMKDNRGRLSVITPVWASYEGDEHSLFVIVGSGPIYDLQDWEGSEFLARSVFVSVGESLGAGVASISEVSNPTVSDVVPLILDPVIEVNISGHSFLPTWWDNDGYSLRFSSGARLVSVPDLQVFSIDLSFLLADGDNVIAEVTRQSGRVTTQRLESATPPSVPVPTTLPDTDAAVWRGVLAGHAVTCRVCGETRIHHNIRCRGDLDSVTKPMLATLEGVKDRFVLLSQRGVDVVATTMRRPVLSLPHNRALVRDAAAMSVVAFDSHRGWERIMDADQYYEVAAGSHAVYV